MMDLLRGFVGRLWSRDAFFKLLWTVGNAGLAAAAVEVANWEQGPTTAVLLVVIQYLGSLVRERVAPSPA